MRVAVTGASGMIGRAVCRALSAQGHDVLAVTRGAAPGGTQRILWQGAASAGTEWAAGLRGADAIVHLAGSSIAAGRWNAARKREIIESRDRATRVLIAALAAEGARPQAFLSMSAVGYYGMDLERSFTEDDPPGDDYLARVCIAWEAAAGEATQLGSRVALLRAGVVLSAEGGMLVRLRTPFRLGLGGPVGNGRQWVSWIAQDDVVGLILHALSDERARGPINLTAPNPVRNGTFGRAMGAALYRPAVVPLPAVAVRLAFGEMGETVLLSGQRVLPQRALALGYEFREPEIDGALRRILQRD
ncbi:MAG: TIGR01777 family oxidoreductase [Thermaerobacter sp.]|nr:TIGR01777 family oxidoreductase [Thermaerobacter sp.]